MKRVLILLCVALLLLGVSGCDKESTDETTEKAIEKSAAEDGQDVDVDVDGDTIKAETDEGDTIEAETGGGSEVPADFPADMPLYDGDIQSATKVTSDEGTVWTVGIAVSDPVDTVAQWYADELEQRDWEIAGSFNMNTADGQSSVTNANKGELEAIVNIAEADDGATLSISVREQ